MRHFQGKAIALSLLLLATPAQAADFAETGIDWSGIYTGINLGLGGTNSSLSPGCIDASGVVNGPNCQVVPGSNMSDLGFVGGALVGYNHQFDQFLVGVEVDFQATSIDASKTIDGPFQIVSGTTALPAAQYTAKERLNWLSTARIRLGHEVAKNTILYGTGGLAIGNYKLETNFTSTHPFTFPAESDVTKVGWTVGGGVEHAMSDKLSIKLDALYYNLGEETVSGGCGAGCGGGAIGFTRSTAFDLQGAVVRFGLNWSLGN